MGIGRKTGQKKTIKPRRHAKGEEVKTQAEIEKAQRAKKEGTSSGGELTNPVTSSRERKALKAKKEAEKKGKK